MRGAVLAAVLLAASAVPAVAAPPPPHVETLHQRLGPFAIKDQRFTVELTLQRIRGRKPAGDDETVTHMAIRDAAGRIHVQADYGAALEAGRFADSLSVSAGLIQGRGGAGLLVQRDSEPAAPLGGADWQLFGLFDGKLVPFSKPISVEGEWIEPPTRQGAPLTTFEEPGLAGETLRFKVWTGYVFAIVPLRVDWIAARIGPAWRCYRMTAKGVVPQCEFPVEAKRIPPDKDLTFVRLQAEPEDGFGVEHVVVKRDSKVEVLAGAGEVIWDEGPDAVSLRVGGDLWLKVRIDGQAGWIHTDEDFQALGLPASG